MTPEEEKANEAIRASVKGGKGCFWAAVVIAALLLVTCLSGAWALIYRAWTG